MKIVAHNINTGGGLILLDELYRRCLVKQYSVKLINSTLVERYPAGSVKDARVQLYPGTLQHLALWPSQEGRLYFGNLPPLIPDRRAAVYIHNLYLTLSLLEAFKHVVRRKLSVKYVLLAMYIRLTKNHCKVVFVQTQGMKHALEKIFSVPVIQMPFFRSVTPYLVACDKTTHICAVGLPSKHKIYRHFLDAVLKLVKQGACLRIEMTIPERQENKDLLELIRQINSEMMSATKANDNSGRVSQSPCIINHGLVGFEAVVAIYSRSKSLLFPSLKESFGLPLLEAAQAQLAVFAPDLPYVDDVITGHVVIDPEDSEHMSKVLSDWFKEGCPVNPVKSLIHDRGDELLNGGWCE